ncbi:MAG: gliding motility protein GldM [Chitinophagaceae bacterium]|nr:gliding motility protein GldM [Chitinophagaceae bacterium]MBK8951180.1 gliding motility protein GldM [Chitinophagaceae bacterium]
MSLPKEPRQKMINIMYLVLTALLALNVSSEILNAFKTVRRSLEATNNTVNQSTLTIMKSLEDKTREPETKERADIWFAKAQKIVKYSTDLNNYIEGIKNEIIKEAGGKPGDLSGFKEDNLDIVTRMMVKQGRGKDILAALKKYSTDIFSIETDPEVLASFKSAINIDVSNPPGQDGKTKAWEIAYFNMVPTVAGLTILSKFQNDIKTSENKLVTLCHQKVGEVKVIFDSYAAIVGQNSNYLMPGQELEIKAGIGAFSKSSLPKISIGGASVAIGEEGYALYKTQAGGVGSHSVPVRISFFNQTTGKEEVKEVTVEYVVGSANASIALDKMNVLYVGVDNPVTIAASGGGDDKVNASITQGSLTKIGPGKYIARVNTVNDNTMINVSVDGKLAGAANFRVRTIPEAQAYVGGKPSGTNISAGEFRAQGGVGAGIKNFPFELEYNVVSYTFTCDTDDDIVSVPAQGAAFAGAVRNAVNQHVQPGRMVTIDDIRVKGPDGRTTPAPSLVYYIK